MPSVWKRLQRVNKRAAKFQYTASYHRVDLETTPKWKPNKLSVVWCRRSRRVVTDPMQWEPSLKDPLKGSVIYTMPENQTVAVTLFKDSRTNELEDKDWTFVLEDVSATGKRRRLASCAVNMRRHASLAPAQRPLLLPLEPCSNKIRAASLSLTLHSVLLREGQATDEDMQSLASLLSVNNNSDIAVLEDLDEDDYTLSDNSTRQMSDFRQQMEEMTLSLSSASSPPSLPLTPTPTQPQPQYQDKTPTMETVNTNPFDYTKPVNSIKIDTVVTSTPKPSAEANDEPRSVVFKPKTIAKRNLKPLELKTNLSCLNLDGNENEKDDMTPTGDGNMTSAKIERDKTPVVELLEWVQSVSSDYPSCRVTDLSTSFRNGLAFCAIIHRFRPDLIDFSGLQPESGPDNVRAALAAGRALGVAPALAARDVCGPLPDRLAIMTYLFQLRAHFTGAELQVGAGSYLRGGGGGAAGGAARGGEHYLVGRHDTDADLPTELFSRETKARSSRNYKNYKRASPEPARSPTMMADVRDMLKNSKLAFNHVVSPRDKDGDREKTNATWFTDHVDDPPPTRPDKLMTRKELTDPFASDEEDDVDESRGVSDCNGDSDNRQKSPSPVSPISDPLNANNILQQSNNKADKVDKLKVMSPDLPKPTPQLLSRHDELKERARQLLEATKREARAKEKEKEREKKRQSSKEKEVKDVVANGLKNGDLSPKKPMTEEERQTMLRERARKLIADARAGIVSPSSPAVASSPAVEVISKQSVMDEIAAAGGVEQLDAMLRDSTHSSPSRRSPGTRSGSEDRASSEGSVKSESVLEGERRSLHSFTELVDRLTPDKENIEEGSYLASELEALELEQRRVDRQAGALEADLRAAMADQRTEEEARLMTQWFNLVNKKNALLRRQMQLNILEQEEDLSRRCELLAKELRMSLAVDEWRKTRGQQRRERLLLQELLTAVNERDRLVQEMDEQEKAIADDDAINRQISEVDIQRKNNCILQ